MKVGYRHNALQTDKVETDTLVGDFSYLTINPIQGDCITQAN